MATDSDLGLRRESPIPSVPEAELEFAAAVQEYKRSSGRTFPTWSEILEIARGLGYCKPTGREEIR